SDIFNGLKDAVSEAFKKVKKAVSDGISKAYDTVTGFFTKFKDAGKEIIENIADGIKEAIGKVTGAMKKVTQKIRDFLPFSPPKTGPLRDIMDVKWGETIAAGILKGERTIESAMEDVLSFDLTKQVTVNNDSSNKHETEVVRLLNELIQAVREGKNIVINDREIGRVLEPTITELQERNKKVRSSFA